MRTINCRECGINKTVYNDYVDWFRWICDACWAKRVAIPEKAASDDATPIVPTVAEKRDAFERLRIHALHSKLKWPVHVIAAWANAEKRIKELEVELNEWKTVADKLAVLVPGVSDQDQGALDEYSKLMERIS